MPDWFGPASRWALTLGRRSACTRSKPPLSGAALTLPVPPAVIVRDAEGMATVRATRLDGEFALDGALTEAIYTTVPPFADFVQQEPQEGQPATEKTEVWLFFDDANVYVGARLHESDPSRRVMSEMRRDSFNLFNNDHLGGAVRHVLRPPQRLRLRRQPPGGMFDWTATNEQPSPNWNGLWASKARDFDGGWTIEMRIPFRSIRFKEGGDVWGMNFRRMVRWKNEISYLNAVPQSWGRRGLNKLSSAATVVGLETPPKRLNIDVKPYALGSVLTNRTATPAFATIPTATSAATPSGASRQQLVADFTYNTDFAQVEDDEPQVNLTRFSLFFPEKRDFFLEGQDTFAFGGVGGGGRRRGGGGGGAAAAAAARRRQQHRAT